MRFASPLSVRDRWADGWRLPLLERVFACMLEDVMPSNLHHAQEELRRELSPGNPDAMFENISFVQSIEDAVREADLAIDCVPDELESKLEILWLLDRMAPPRTVLATPTTNLSIADLASCTYRPEKCIAIALDPRAFSWPSGIGHNPAQEDGAHGG